MSESYYYAINRKRAGPISFEKLRELASKGQLRRQTKVWCRGMKEWQTAGSVAKLFDSLPPELEPKDASPASPKPSASGGKRPVNPRNKTATVASARRSKHGAPQKDKKMAEPPRDEIIEKDGSPPQVTTTTPKRPARSSYWLAASSVVLICAMGIAWPIIKSKLVDSAVASARYGDLSELSWRVALIGDTQVKNKLLREACQFDHPENVDFLLARGSDPNAVQEGELPSLEIALRSAVLMLSVPSRVKIVQSLLNAGANPNLQDAEGNTSLHVVGQSGDWGAQEIAELLIQKGALVNAANHFGLTPLDYAQSNCLSIVSLLHDKGAVQGRDVDALRPPIGIAELTSSYLLPGRTNRHPGVHLPFKEPMAVARDNRELLGRWRCNNIDGWLTLEITVTEDDHKIHVSAKRDGKYVSVASAEASGERTQIKLVVQLNEKIEVEKDGAVFGSSAADQALGIRPSVTPPPIDVTNRYELIYESSGDRLSGACSGSKYAGPVSFMRVGRDLDPYLYNN